MPPVIYSHKRKIKILLYSSRTSVISYRKRQAKELKTVKASRVPRKNNEKVAEKFENSKHEGGGWGDIKKTG